MENSHAKNCGRFILNDGQSQAPSFDLDNDVGYYLTLTYTMPAHTCCILHRCEQLLCQPIINENTYFVVKFGILSQ